MYFDTIAVAGLATPANSGGRGVGTETLQRANHMPREEGTAPAGQKVPAPANSERSHVQSKTLLRVMFLNRIYVRKHLLCL